MSGPVRLNKPSVSALRWRRMNGVLAVMAMLVVLGGLSPSVAQAQKSINFMGNGSVRSSLLFVGQVSPDVYSFVATAGEQIRVETSNTTVDTTIRVIGPDAFLNLFDDDGGAGNASRLVFTAADTGVYIVVVSSFSGNPVTTQPEYTLNFARGAAAAQSLSTLRVDMDPTYGESMSDGENPVEEKPLR